MNNCPHYNHGQCTLATELAQAPVPVNQRACDECHKCRPPRAVNRLVISLAYCTIRKTAPARAESFAATHLGPGTVTPATTPPSLFAQAWSVTKAVAGFVADGFRTVDADTYQARLALCDACPQRDNHRCQLCNCFVAVKARLPREQCPQGLWPPCKS